MIKAGFIKVHFTKLKIRRGPGKNVKKIVGTGAKGGEYKILKNEKQTLRNTF